MNMSHAVSAHEFEPTEQYEEVVSQKREAVGNVCSINWEQVQSDDKLGCARGIVWAVVLEIATAITAVVMWKLHFHPH